MSNFKQEALDALGLYKRNMAHIVGKEDAAAKAIETCIKLIDEIEEKIEPKKFWVVDTLTRKEADPYEIALHEKWAKNLMYCDMEGFAIEEDGTLILLDECGTYECCPLERFKVIWDE